MHQEQCVKFLRFLIQSVYGGRSSYKLIQSTQNCCKVPEYPQDEYSQDKQSNLPQGKQQIRS